MKIVLIDTDPVDMLRESYIAAWNSSKLFSIVTTERETLSSSLYPEFKHVLLFLQSCVDYLGEKGEQLKEDKLLLPALANHNQEMSMLHECSQDTDAFPRTPEENVHEPSQATQEVDSGSMSDLGLTDNGNYVKQEMGKTERLSRQESQTQNTSL